MENKEPIYKFEGLKDLLISLGYIVNAAQGYREVENKDVDINNLKNDLEFTDDGIFLMDSKYGSKQQIFLYKSDYHLQKYGKPRFHIRECEIIQEFMASGTLKSEYKYANTDKVLVYDMDNAFKQETITNLPLCQYCAKMIAIPPKDTSDFVAILKKADKESNANSNNMKVDILGYTEDWPAISEAYREIKNYTCERCGVQMNNSFDQHYIHVHHKDGNKTNNRTSNLECLCIRCHAKVDEVHKRNFSSKANKIMLEQFNESYPETITNNELSPLEIALMSGHTVNVEM